VTRAVCWKPAITRGHPKAVTCWLDEGGLRSASLEGLQADETAVPVTGRRNTPEGGWR
jgi:hypothetical protein